MNTEERQLSEMLHRVTPEPPRRVTVEDVAFRLAGQAVGRGLRRGRRGGPASRNRDRRRGWAPAVAAASVIAVAAVSAGIASALSSHNNGVTSITANNEATSPPSSEVPSSAQAPPSSTPTGPVMQPRRIAGGPWSAELINDQVSAPGPLAAGPDALYAFGSSAFVRIDPGTGDLTMQVPHDPATAFRPVVLGGTVWVIETYAGSSVVLRGYDTAKLSQVASVTVPVSGQVPDSAAGVLAGSGGYLYVAAGSSVAVVDPAAKRAVRRISVPAGPVDSVAVSQDGGKLYVSVGSLQLLTYSTATGAQLKSSGIADLTSTAGNLVATPGGVWGTAGVGMSEWAWFAPGGDLTRMVHVTQGTGDGTVSAPTYSGGVVWLGGSHTLACADPGTGQMKASAVIPADNGVAEHVGSVAVTGGHAFALYQDQAGRQAGLVRFTPPAAC